MKKTKQSKQPPVKQVTKPAVQHNKPQIVAIDIFKKIMQTIEGVLQKEETKEETKDEDFTYEALVGTFSAAAQLSYSHKISKEEFLIMASSIFEQTTGKMPKSKSEKPVSPIIQKWDIN